MIVKFNDQDLSISFLYEKKVTYLDKDHKLQTDFLYGKDAFSECIDGETCQFSTYATIERRLGPKNYEPIVTGEALKHPTDKPNRVVGRKLALMRALQNFDARVNNGIKNSEFRKLVWQEYFKNHKDGKLVNFH